MKMAAGHEGRGGVMVMLVQVQWCVELVPLKTSIILFKRHKESYNVSQYQ